MIDQLSVPAFNTLPADITAQFDQIMAANFAVPTFSTELVAMEPEAEIVGDSTIGEGIEFDLDSFMLQQTALGDLSLDNADTRKAIESKEGLEALMAQNLTHETLGNVAITMTVMPIAVAQHYELSMRPLDIFDFNDDGDDEEDEGSTRAKTGRKLLFA